MKLLLSLFLSLIFLNSFDLKAQCENDPWGCEPQLAKEKYTVFSDDVKAKNYQSARGNLVWLLKNVPKNSKGLYQNAEKVYDGLVNAEKDAKVKANLQDSLLMIFDLRIKYFGDEANVIQRKGNYALTFWQSRPEKQEELFDLYKKIFELNGDNTLYTNVQYYMYMACTMKQANKKDLNDEKMLELHEKLSEVIEKNAVKDAKYKATWDGVQDYIDKQLEGCVKINCENLDKLYTPKFKENPNDTVLLKKMYGVMIKGKCTDDPLFFEVAKKIVEKAPTGQRIKVLASLYKAKGDFATYLSLMDKFFNMGFGTNAEKAEFYLALGVQEQQKGNFPGAKAYFLKAVATDASVAGKAYSAIGYLYLNSAGSCKGSDPSNPCHAKAVNIAAYSWFQKAGDAGGMSTARSRYPTKEEIFTYSMGGQAVNIGCWIGETVTIPAL